MVDLLIASCTLNFMKCTKIFLLWTDWEYVAIQSALQADMIEWITAVFFIHIKVSSGVHKGHCEKILRVFAHFPKENKLSVFYVRLFVVINSYTHYWFCLIFVRYTLQFYVYIVLILWHFTLNCNSYIGNCSRFIKKWLTKAIRFLIQSKANNTRNLKPKLNAGNVLKIVNSCDFQV